MGGSGQGLSRVQKWTLALVLLAGIVAAASQAWIITRPELQAITFAAEPGRLYLPVNEAADALGWEVERNPAGRVVALNQLPVKPGTLHSLRDGTELAGQESLTTAGAVVAAQEDGSVTVRRGWRRFLLRAGAQRVEISLAKQQLEGWQGGRRVLRTRVSSGKDGSTPAGTFRAGPYRARMHRSSLYNNAPMPWSVQINGNVFVHGFTSVPAYPASHGCIRVPLDEGNPAKLFYEWVQTGTPVRVSR